MQGISSMRLETTMRLRQSMRESRFPIDVLAMSPTNGNVLSADEGAVRLWSLQRQLRAQHANQETSAVTRAIGAFYLEDLDVFLVVYSYFKRRVSDDSDDDDEDGRPCGGMVQIWTADLHLLQQIELDYAELKHCTISADKKQLALVDINDNLYIIEMLHMYVAPRPEPRFRGPKGRSPTRAEAPQKLKVFLKELQVVTFEDPELIIDVVWAQESRLCLLYAGELIMYSCRDRTASVDTSGWSVTQLNRPDEDLGTYAITHKYAITCPEDAFPTSMVMLDPSKYGLGFSDGTIRVVRCPSAEKERGDALEDANILVEVDGHEVTRGPRSTVLINTTWSSRAPGGHQVEFISAGGTKRGIKVWGLRLSNSIRSNDDSAVRVYSLSGIESVDDVPVDSMGYALDELGRFSIVQDPYSKVQSKKTRSIRVGKFHMTSYDLKTSYGSNPLRRELICGFGGMMACLEVHQPFRNITEYKDPQKIVHACTGPIVSYFASPETGSFRSDSSENCCATIILRDECVDVLDSGSGEVIRQFGTRNLSDEFKPKLETIGQNNTFNEEMREREGRPTAVYWCHISNVIMLGYSTGGTGFLRPNSKSEVILLDTLAVHNSSIRVYHSFYQHIINKKNEHQFNQMLLVGDESGVVSLWRFKDNKYFLIKHYEAHNGAIIFLDSISGYNSVKKNNSGIEKVLLTACSGGIVKAWVQNHVTGELMMTAYFKTSSPIQSFLPVLLINSASVASVEMRKNSSMQRDTMQSLDGSNMSQPVANEFVVHVLCLCGLKSGILEGWVMSTQGNTSMNASQFPGANVLSPLWALPVHDAPISTITRMRGLEEGMLQDGNHYQAMCSSLFGSSVIIQVDASGALEQAPKFFTLPFSVRTITNYTYQPGNNEAPVFDEYVAIGEHKVVEISPSIRFDISRRWNDIRNEQLPTLYRQRANDNGNSSRVSYGQVEDLDKEMDDGVASKDSALSVGEEVEEMSREEIGGDGGYKFDLSYSDDQFIEIAGSNAAYKESMESMERAVTSDLFFAKKDPNLISLFVQAPKVDASNVDTATGIKVIFDWLKQDLAPTDQETDTSVNKLVVWETMLLMGIKQEDTLSFIKIAKVAALTAAVVKKQLKDTLASARVTGSNKRNLWRDYYKLRSSKKVISYNAIGEPSVDTVELKRNVATGLPLGNDLKITRFMASIDSRIMDPYVTNNKNAATATFLESIPPKFAKHFQSKWLAPVHMPEKWDSANQHWFDLRRAVRVARAIFDMRSAKQHEYVMGENIDKKQIWSMPKLTCLYFERSFGHGRLNVSNHKILHFLEACLQYQTTPVMNFLQLCLVPGSPKDEPEEICLWIYVELRHMLQARGVVEEGDVIPSIDTFSGSRTKQNESAQLHWQLISRNEAVNIIDEMFHSRGKFGVQCLQKMYKALDAIPDTNYKNISRSMIDMEVFLFSITMEFSKVKHLLREMESSLFDVKNVPTYKVASSRDIYFEIPQKVPVNYIARKANIRLSLEKIHELLVQFIHHDPRRLGIVDQITFRSIVVVAGQAILYFECGRDAHKLVDECLHKFRDADVDSSVSYADFIAALLAYILLEQGGSHGLDGTAALEAIQGELNIGIGEKEAAALILLIGTLQCPPAPDIYWTVRPQEVSDAKSILDTEGDWVLKPPLVEIADKTLKGDNAKLGSLSVMAKSIPRGTHMEEKPGSMEVRHMKERLEELSYSYVPDTSHSMITPLSQEVLNLSKSNLQKKPQAVLIFNDMSMANKIDSALDKESSIVEKTAPNLYKKLLSSSSYSKSLTKEADPRETPADSFEQPLNTSDSDLMHSPYGNHSFMLDHRERTMSGAFNGQAYDNDVSILQRKGDRDPLRTKIASDEVDRRRGIMTSDEQEYTRHLEMEQERFAKRRAMKEARHSKEQSVARAKARKTMKFKAKQDNLRQQRRVAGAELYERAVTAERTAINAAYEEQQRKREEERARVHQIKLAKEAEEELEREKQREVAEGIGMRAADRETAAYEKAFKEKTEKDAKEKAEKEAKEAAAAAEKRAKELAEEEARAAAAAKKAEEEAKEAEEVARRANYKGMKAEDFNVLSILTEEELAKAAEQKAKEEAEAADADTYASDEEGEEDTFVGSGVDDDGEVDSDSPRKYTPAEERFLEFLDKMKNVKNRHTQHPRKVNGDTSYFMPMLFSADISYDNFSAPMYEETRRLSEWNIEDIGTTKMQKPRVINMEVKEGSGAFSDIAQKVKEHKIQMLRDRLENLYRTSSSEESPADWTEVMKKNFVDWVSFFDEQEGILMQRPPTPPPPIDHEGIFFKKIAALAAKLEVMPEDEEVAKVPESMPVPKDEAVAEVTPLPLGKVMREIVLNKAYKYFQVEIVDPHSKLTFELKSTRGYADMYLSNTSVLPTVINHQKRAHSGDHNKRIARLVFTPESHGTLILGVYSELGAQFELWGFASGHVTQTSDHILKVSQNLRRWEIIQNHTIEEMETKLPELMSEASNIVEFENSMAVPSILADYHEHNKEASKVDVPTKVKPSAEVLNMQSKAGDAAEESKGPPADDSDSEDDEVTTMDNFISKAGRRLIRKDLLNGKGLLTDLLQSHVAEVDEDGDEIDYFDPNSHVELFKRPVLTSKDKYMSIIAREPELSQDENVNFITLSLLKRGGHTTSRRRSRKDPHPMSMSLPSLNLNYSSSLHESMTSSLTSGYTKSTAQKPFKLPSGIAGVKTEKIKYTLHRTEKKKR